MKKPTKIEWVPFLCDKREDSCSDEDDLMRLVAELALQLKTDVMYDSYDGDGISTMSVSYAKEILDGELREAVDKQKNLTSGISKRKKELLNLRARVTRLRSLLR